MPPSDKLYAISRRRFFTIAGAGGVGLLIAGCSDSGSAPDASSGGTCTTDGIDVGPASAFVMGVPVYFESALAYVARDSGGLYAMSALCTHQGALTCIGTAAGCTTMGPNVIFCPRHGAVFSFDGTIVRGPAGRSLDHVAMCMLSNGNVGVLATTNVASSVRLPV